jgi:hypothetical protein
MRTQSPFLQWRVGSVVKEWVPSTPKSSRELGGVPRCEFGGPPSGPGPGYPGRSKSSRGPINERPRRGTLPPAFRPCVSRLQSPSHCTVTHANPVRGTWRILRESRLRPERRGAHPGSVQPRLSEPGFHLGDHAEAHSRPDTSSGGCRFPTAEDPGRARHRGVALRGVALRGVALRGVALRGVALRGVALNGRSRASAHSAAGAAQGHLRPDARLPGNPGRTPPRDSRRGALALPPADRVA